MFESPGAVPILNYKVPLKGVIDSVSIYIHRELKNIPSSAGKSILCILCYMKCVVTFIGGIPSTRATPSYTKSEGEIWYTVYYLLHYR